MKLFGIINVVSVVTDLHYTLYIRQLLEKKWEYNGKVHQLFFDFKKAYDPIKREVL
jgi:hypothetical protein